MDDTAQQPAKSQEQIREDLKFVQAIREPAGDTVLNHFEDVLFDLVKKLALDDLTTDRRYQLADEIAALGRLFKGAEDRIRDVLSQASRAIVRSQMHAAQTRRQA